MKSQYDFVRYGQRVIRMVSELHRMGYQRLRIMPYMYPLGWRLAIAPCDVFSTRNGTYIPDHALGDGCAITGSGNTYFDWEDATADNARQLAEKFIARFPDIATRGDGRDWLYAGWLCELVGFLENGDWLPAVSWEHMLGTTEDAESLPIWIAGKDTNVEWIGSGTVIHRENPTFPLPPPSMAPSGT